MPDVVNIVPPWIVEELTGQRRKVILTARAVPRRGVTFGVMQRAEFTYVQGNPNADVAVAGSQELDVPLSGVWRDKYLGTSVAMSVADRGPNGALANVRPSGNLPPASVHVAGEVRPLETAQALVDMFDELVRLGGLLRVTWGPMTRIGLVTEFTWKYDTLHDIEWSMKNEWTGRDDPRVVALFTPEYADRPFARTLLDRLTALSNTLTAPFDAVQSVMNEYTSALNAVRLAYNTLLDAADTAVSGVLSPFDAARSTIDALNSMIVGLDGWAEDVANRAVESFLSPLDRIATGEGVTLGDKIRAELWKNDLAANLSGLSQQLQERVLAIEARLGDDRVDTYVATGNETLRDVSELYYGTAETWKQLMVYNNMRSSALVRGQVVRVPEVLPP